MCHYDTVAHKVITIWKLLSHLKLHFFFAYLLIFGNTIATNICLTNILHDLKIYRSEKWENLQKTKEMSTTALQKKKAGEPEVLLSCCR